MSEPSTTTSYLVRRPWSWRAVPSSRRRRRRRRCPPCCFFDRHRGAAQSVCRGRCVSPSPSWSWRPLFVVAADCVAAASMVRSPCRRLPVAEWCRRSSWLRRATNAPSRGPTRHNKSSVTRSPRSAKRFGFRLGEGNFTGAKATSRAGATLRD